MTLLSNLLNHLSKVSILGNSPMREQGWIRSVTPAAEHDRPLVASLPEHDVVVAISELEDPPVGAGDGRLLLGRTAMSSVCDNVIPERGVVSRANCSST
jgi:hypothetical protein